MFLFFSVKMFVAKYINTDVVFAKVGLEVCCIWFIVRCSNRSNASLNVRDYSETFSKDIKGQFKPHRQMVTNKLPVIFKMCEKCYVIKHNIVIINQMIFLGALAGKIKWVKQPQVTGELLKVMIMILFC